MIDKPLDKLILEMLSRQNKLMIDRILPRLEDFDDRLKKVERVLIEANGQNIESRLTILAKAHRELSRRLGDIEFLVANKPSKRYGKDIS